MKKQPIMLIVLFTIIFALTACGGNDAIPEITTPTHRPVDLYATSIALTAQAPRPTSAPITAIPLAFTSEPLLPSLSRSDFVNARAIYFDPGATSTALAEMIEPGQIRVYSLLIHSDNQPAQILVTSQSNDVSMTLQDTSGTEMLAPAYKYRSWQGHFLKKGTYYLKVYGGSVATRFDLTMTIAARIENQYGAVSTMIKDKTTSGGTISYGVMVGEGQVLEVTVVSPANAVALGIAGFNDGYYYVRAEAGATTYALQAPTTQDYIISVVPQVRKEMPYVLYVAVKYAPAATPVYTPTPIATQTP